MQVVYATVIGVLVFAEPLSPLVVAGGVLVLAGALLATFEPAARRLTPPLSSDSSLPRPARDLGSGD
jgi:hypothetical protein